MTFIRSGGSDFRRKVGPNLAGANTLATNGVFSKRVRERLAEQNLWVICSIDGDRDTHNHYRPGTFDTIMENLRYLKSKNPGMRLRLTTVLTRRNKGQMRQLGTICRDLDAESITVIPLRPQVRNPEAAADMIDAGEFKKVLRELVEVKHELGVKFTTTLETEFAEEIYRDPVFRKRSSCAAGREGTNLDYDAARGRFFLYGCSYCPASDLDAAPALRAPFVAGSFPADEPHKFLEIWRDDKAWKLFRDLDIRWSQCKDCHYFKRACTGSCPIQNLDYTKIDMDEDVLEQLRRQIAGTAEWYCYKNIMG